MQEQVLSHLTILFYVLGPLIFVVLLFVLALIIYSPWFKEVIGKTFVLFGSQLKLEKENYFQINNVTLSTGSGSTQIDHIIVSVYGVFVVEDMDLRGKISGGVHHQTWTQQINRHSHKFQNPLLHIDDNARIISKMLGLSKHQIHSLVVFTGDSSFTSEMPENVITNLGYIPYINSKTEPVFVELEVQNMIEMIESGMLAESLKTPT